MNCPIIAHLQEWRAALAGVTDFPSLEAKAEHIGLLNRIDTAIVRLKMCEKYEIYPAAWICKLPPELNPQFSQSFFPEYRIVCDHETEEREYWEEVSFDKHGIVRLTAGDLVIKK